MGRRGDPLNPCIPSMPGMFHGLSTADACLKRSATETRAWLSGSPQKVEASAVTQQQSPSCAAQPPSASHKPTSRGQHVCSWCLLHKLGFRHLPNSEPGFDCRSLEGKHLCRGGWFPRHCMNFFGAATSSWFFTPVCLLASLSK